MTLLPFWCLSQSDEEKAEYENRHKLIHSLITSNPDSALLLINIQRKFVIELGHQNAIANQAYQEAYFYAHQPNAMDSMLKYSMKAAAIYEEIENHVQGSNIHNGLGSKYYNFGNFEKAETHFLKALELAKLAKDTNLILGSIGGLSGMELGRGNDVEALEYAFEATDIWNSVEDPSHIRNDPRVSIAAVYSYQGEDAKFRDITLELIATFVENEDNWSAAQWSNNLASVYLKADDLENAKLVLWSAIYHAKKANFNYALADAHATLGTTYVKAGMLDSARYHIEQIDIAVPKIEEPNFLAEASYAKGLYYQAAGNRRTAIKYMETALLTYESLGVMDHSKDVAFSLFELYQETGNSKRALEKHIQYTAFKDSLFSKEKIEEFKETELRHEFEQERFADSLQTMQAQYDVELAHQEDLSNEQQGKRMLYVGLAFLGLVILFVAFAFFRKRSQSLVLNEKNKEIQDALDAKQMLLKELHHRVKNNFQIVSSLLELQGKEIEDEAARALTQEGQNRVKSMAYIHQKLYQNDEFLISMTEYVNTLVQEISLMYGHNDVEVKLGGGEHQFDVDTAIPLGLIINELVTNAFKYGFEEEQRILEIAINKKGEDYELKVGDNGVGLPSDFDIGKSKSLGLRLVKRLSRQLQGSFSYDNTNGSVFTVMFKDYHGRSLVD